MTDSDIAIGLAFFMIIMDSIFDLIHVRHIDPKGTIGPLKDTISPLGGLIIFLMILLATFLGVIVIKTFPTWSHFLGL